VATDIASRGIDVGDAFTLMSPDEKKGVVEIEKFLGQTILRVMMPDFDYDARSAEPSFGGARGGGGRSGGSGGFGGRGGESHGPRHRAGGSHGGSGGDGRGGDGAGKPEEHRAGRRPRKALPFERRPRRPR
jgi:hypothetical protein